MRKILLFAIIIATYVEISDRCGYGPQKQDVYPSSPSVPTLPKAYVTRSDSVINPYPEDIHDPNTLDFNPTSDTFDYNEVEKYRD